MSSSKFRRRSRLAPAALAFSPVLLSRASATTRTYAAASGDWNTAGNWSPSGLPAGGANSTTAGDTVNITSNGNTSLHTVTFDVNNYSASSPIGPLTIDLTGGFGNSDTLLMTANTLAVYGGDQVGLSGTGTFTQTGGTHIVGVSSGTALGIGVNSGSTGLYTLGNTTGATPTLIVNAVEVEGVSGTGTFTQNSGAHALNGAAGVLYVGLNSGSVGNFTLGGGTFTTNGFDGQSISACVGYSGTGTFTQNGGTATVGVSGVTTDYLVIGDQAGSVGTYSMNNVNAPTLTVNGGEIIGYSATGTTTSGTITQYGGTFTQNAGVHTVDYQLILGDTFNATGSYLLTGGSLTAAADAPDVSIQETIGYFGTGHCRVIEYNQSGDGDLFQ